MKRLIIAGCGPHFRRAYLSVLEQYCGRLEIVLVVDLEGEETGVYGTFANSSLRPHAYVFLSNKLRATLEVADVQAALNSNKIVAIADSILICSEPKSHKAFALWGLESGLSVFMDKPVSAFIHYRDFSSLKTDFEEILRARQLRNKPVVISCERRFHHGYRYIEAFLANFVNEFQVPITYVNVHFAGGIWVMPWEFSVLENHPLKYGYGILLHSGYHYIDLIVRLAELNKRIRDLDFDHPRVKANASFPNDVLDAVGTNIYPRLFPDEAIHNRITGISREELEPYGETDISIIGSYLANSRKCFDFSLQLIGTSVSARSTPIRRNAGQPTNGRIRQEEVLIHLGNFCTVSIHSSPFLNLETRRLVDEFDITIAQNPLFTKGDAVTRIDRRRLSDIYDDLPINSIQNIVAQETQLRLFLDGKTNHSDIVSHVNSITLLTEIFSEIRAD